mgnify:CR=1 FL=1
MSDKTMRERRMAYQRNLPENKKVLKDVQSQLEEALRLLENGEKDAVCNIVNQLKENLEKRIELENTKCKSESTEKFDKSIFPKTGMLIGEDRDVVMFVTKASEKEEYLSLSHTYSQMKNAYKDEKFLEKIWNSFIGENVFACSVYDKKTKTFVGYCTINELRQKEWELAIELKPEWCHRGYGTQALTLFVNCVTEITGNYIYRARVEIDNYASQALLKKLGAYPNGISEYELHGKNLDQFKRENTDLIDDKLQAVAEEFCMEAEDILGYVLEYRLEVY